MARSWLLVCVVATMGLASAGCPNFCSGHGDCSTDGLLTCSCYTGFQGPDCSERTCPYGVQWSGVSTTTDGLHAQRSECSNMVR
jgi:hypothetical protein